MAELARACGVAGAALFSGIPSPVKLTGRWPSRAARLALQTEFDGDVLPRLTGLDARIGGIVQPTLADMGYELVRVAVLGRERPTVQVMVDRADGTALGIEDCEQISHALGAVLDVADPLPQAWTLEVSSAGIDRPLTRRKDWMNFVGHLARVELETPIEGRKRISGVIRGADGVGAEMMLDSGEAFTVPFAAIRRAKLVLTDALIDATAQAAAPAADAH